jgi:hypothetical protein
MQLVLAFMPATLGRRVAALAAIAAISLPQGADAQSVQIKALGCDKGVQLTSRSAPLSKVLQQMSTCLGFSVSFWAHDDPPVVFEGRNSPAGLLRALSAYANIGFSVTPDTRCPGREQVRSVWVVSNASLPKRAQARRSSVPASAATAPWETQWFQPDSDSN